MVVKTTIDETLYEELQRLSDKEKKAFLKALQGGDRATKKHQHFFSRKHAKIGVISDTHIGHQEFREDALMRAFKYFKRQRVEAIYHVGDVVEGMSSRHGHVYELALIGATTQVRKAAELFAEAPTMIYGITGNHDHWLKKINNAGFLVGDDLEARCENFTFLGEDEADVELSPGVVMKLYHPGDGTAYARSYKLQKLIESFTGGEKPNIVLQGHYHKAGYDFIRNVHGFDAGTLMGQSRWMRGKKIAAHVGFWVLDFYFNKTGVERVKSEWVPCYDG